MVADDLFFRIIAAAKENLIREAQRSAYIRADSPVRARFAQGLDNRLLQVNVPAGNGERQSALKGHRRRQHHIQIVMGPAVQIEVSGNRKLHLLKGLLVFLGLRPHHRILAHHEGRADIPIPDILRELVELDFIDELGPDGEILPVHADFIQFALGIGQRIPTKGAIHIQARSIGYAASTCHIQATAQWDERANCAANAHAVDMMGESSPELIGDGAAGVKQHVNGCLDGLLRNAADFGSLSHGVLGAAGLILLKAMGVVFHKLMVIGATFNIGVAKAQSQSRVRARADLQVDISQPGHGWGDPGIHHDHFCASILGGLQLLKGIGGGPGRIGAPVDKNLCFSRGGGASGGQHAGAIVQAGCHARARRAGGAFSAVVGRAEVERQALQHRPRLLGVASGEHDLVSAVFFLDAVEFFGNGGQRLIPGDALPAGVFTAFGVCALHGIQQAVWVIKILNGSAALGADVDVRVAFPALKADNLIVLDNGLDAALGAMVAHNTMAVFYFLRGILIRPGNGFRE